MSDYNSNRQAARLSLCLEDETLRNENFFENSAADFMHTITEGVEELHDKLNTPVPTNLTNSPFSSFQSTPQDDDPRSSFNGSQYQVHGSWQDGAKRGTNWTDLENTINPRLLSYSSPTYPQSPNNYISDSDNNLYSGFYDQVPRQLSPTAQPTNPSFYSTPSSSLVTQDETSSTAPWTPSETQTLQYLRSLGQSYALISQQLPGRSEASCRQRYSRITRKSSSHESDNDGDRGEDGTLARARWTAEEDEVLNEVVARGDSFEEAARLLKGRSAAACRNRHYEYLGPWRSRKRGY